MTADLAYADALQSVREIFDRRSDILDVEFLCGFNHWMLGYVLDSLVGATFPTKQRYGCPDQVAATLVQMCDRSTELMAPLLRQGPPGVGAQALSGAQDEPALYAYRATGFCLRRVLGELKAPTRRWARGETDEVLAKDAQARRALLIAFTEEVFAALRQVAVSFVSDDAQQFGRSIKATVTILAAALEVLWSIASFKKIQERGLDVLVATLDEEVDSEAVQEAGQLAQRAMHRIWMRLHDEIASIERSECPSSENQAPSSIETAATSFR